MRPIRDNENQCTWGTNWRFASYDRAATRALIKAIRAAAPGHVKLIYFNDPVLIREGLTRGTPATTTTCTSATARSRTRSPRYRC